ncbi:MAG: hypothetical protein IT454_18065 [Planctomycetes bacterium]|nr:hypothetical protein [Planctomycetota bacterium]
MTTIFYSWQSDLPNPTNRGFIKDALLKAIKELNKSPAFVDAPRELDVDTSGVPGSPDIADTILDKIGRAEVCVFDVSIIGLAIGRPCPNPNVLIELGYAVQAFSWNRVIMVINEAYGRREDLPFDIRGRRIVEYDAAEGSEGSAEEKKKLVGKLKGGLDACYHYLNKHRFSEPEKQFFADVYDNARGFLDSGAEHADRCLKPWSDELRLEWAERAERFRRAASSDAAARHADLASAATLLAASIDGLVNFRHALGNGHEFSAKLRDVMASAAPLLPACAEPMRPDFEEGPDYGRRKRELSRCALAEVDRLRNGLEARDPPSIQAARKAMSEIGGELLRLSAELEIIASPDAAVLRQAAHALHVAHIRKSQEIGFREDTKLLERLTPLVQAIARFAQPS